MINLIVNADDFGLTSGVNEAIIECFQSGSITSTTLMVNMGSTEDAVMKAKSNLELGVGLHFNLTLGRPISDCKDIGSLVDKSGSFFNRTRLALRIVSGRVDSEHVELELAAQLARFLDLGLSPTHIDSHQHVHGFSTVFDAIAKLCEAREMPMRVPKVLDIKSISVEMKKRLKKKMMSKMVERSCKKWDGKVNWNTGLGSIFDLGEIPENLTDEHYLKVLAGAKDGVFELMVHPAMRVFELDGLTRIGHISEREWEYLKTDKFATSLQESKFVLKNYQSAWN